MPVISDLGVSLWEFYMPDSTKSQQPKLLDQVRQVLRLHHYSIHTERSYVDWIVRFVRFHSMRSREHLFPAEAKIESFLTDLAVHANVAPATQNQAMNALVFLYKRVLKHPLQDSINAVRADKKINVPVVMTREEVAAVISLMDGTAQVVAKLLYGSGLRIMEAVRLRVKDVDFQMKQLTVRSGKGDKDRFTTFPATLTPLFQNHLAGVNETYEGHETMRGNRNKVFFLGFLELVFLQLFVHFPEMPMSTKFAFDSDLEFSSLCFSHP